MTSRWPLLPRARRRSEPLRESLVRLEDEVGRVVVTTPGFAERYREPRRDVFMRMPSVAPR